MENNKLDKRTKWSYCIGATGRDMAYALVSMFLLTYIQYTMKLTVAQYAVISAIMVVCLLWDAINDPMMGIIIENSHLKAGKFKPWIFIGVILNSLIIICLFTVRPEGWGFVAFFGVGYLLWGMTYTMNDIAYWGMLPSLTSDPGERNWLVTVQGIFICIGQFSVAGLLPDMVAGNAIMAYRTAAIVIAFCFIGFQLLTVFGVKERKRPEKKRTLSLKDMFHIFLRNDQLIVIGIACLLFQIGNALLIMIGMNFFYFEFGYSVGGSLVFWFTIMYGLGTLISEASFAWLSSKFTRNQIITAATIITVIGYMLFMSVGYILPKSVALMTAKSSDTSLYFAKINGEQVWKLVENYLDHTEDEFSITNKYELPILSGMKITVQKEENGFLLKDIAVDQEKIDKEKEYSILLTDVTRSILEKTTPGCRIKRLPDMTLSSAWTAFMEKGQQPLAPEDYIEVEK